MTYFLVEGFGGKNSKADPTRLPDNAAQYCVNCTLDRGALFPLFAELDVGHGNVVSNAISLFWYKRSQWLAFPFDVDFCEIPLQNDIYDRILLTTLEAPYAYPHIYSNGAYYRAGLPIPDQISASVQESPEDPDGIDAETVSYVCTFVDDFGVEGPPSKPSALADRVIDTPVDLALPPVPTGEWNFGANSFKRIYRSSSGAGQSGFLYAGQVPITDTVATDIIPNDELQEPLPSATWVGPPDDDIDLYPHGPMIGVCSFSNGILAGFSGKTLCFSEPYLYHAWPIEYRITLEDPVVAIAAISGGLLAVTQKKPYLIAGVHPAALSVIQMDEQAGTGGQSGSASRGCVSKRGMVDMGGFAVYPSSDGLVLVEGNNAVVVTEGILTPAQWKQRYSPSNINAYVSEGKYIAFCTPTKGFIFDPRNQQQAFADVDRSYIGAAYDPDNGDLIVNDDGVLKKWNGDETLENSTPYRWRSKKFVAPKQISLSVARVETWYPLDTPLGEVTMRVWADSVELPTITLTDPVWRYHRLPAGFRAKVWEFEITGRNPISYAGVFEAMDEVI